jgi:hypothetical protein
VGVGRGRVAVVVAKTHRWKSVLLTPPCYLSRILIRMLHAEEKGIAGWKGRSLLSNFSEIPVWHIEGGKSAVSILLHFQLRPDPLAH